MSYAKLKTPSVKSATCERIKNASIDATRQRKCAGIEDPEVRARCEAERERQIQVAVSYIANADVSIGQNEDGFIAIYDTETSEASVRRNSAAGNASSTGFGFTDDNGSRLETNRQGVVMGPGGRTTQHLLVTAHSHPQAFGPSHDQNNPNGASRKIDEANEYLKQNPDDTFVLQFAPVVIKTPTGAVREFRSSGRCSGPTGCQHRAGTPFPTDHYSDIAENP